MKNDDVINETELFGIDDLLEVYLDLVNRQLCSNLKQRNVMDSVGRELELFLGLQKKTYNGQILYIISDILQIKSVLINYLEHCYRGLNLTVKRLNGEYFVMEYAQDNQLIDGFDLLIVEDIDSFYNHSAKIQKKLTHILMNHLNSGGKLLVTGCEFDNTGDPLSQLLYQGNLLNLTY